MLFIVHLSIYFKSSSSSRRARLEHIVLYVYYIYSYICFMIYIMLLCYRMAVYDFFCCKLFLDLHINMYTYICTIHDRYCEFNHIFVCIFIYL